MLSIRWIVTAAAVVLTAAPVLTVGFVSERNSRAALGREVETRLLLGARSLATASSGILLGEVPELLLHPVVRTMQDEQAELAFAVVTDHAGLIQGHADARLLGSRFTPPTELRPVDHSRGLKPGESLRSNGKLLVAEAPVRQADGRVIGTALIGLEQSYLEATIAASRRQQATVLAVLVLLGVFGAFLSMSLLLRPVDSLRAGLERIGRGDLETPIRVHDRTELGLLADSMNDVARRLKQAQQEMLEHERLAHEVGLARQIQTSLLPAGPLESGSIAIRGLQRAAAEVGGDYYDILPLADGRVAITIADVSGKGLAGCLVMAMLSALLRALRHLHDSPSALLGALDEQLAQSLQPGVFVTMFYAVVDPTTGRLTFASAGHNPTLIYRHAAGGVEGCATSGIPLGATRRGQIRRTLRDQTIQLDPGDVLVQYTDGYTEAFGKRNDELFGLERLQQVVAQHGGEGDQAVIGALRQALGAWTGGAPPSDDETLLVLSRVGSVAADEAIPATSKDNRPTVDGDGARAAMQRLAEAERRGQCLRLQADLDSVTKVLEWMKGVPLLADLSHPEAEQLSTALYEVCANIAEHGCGNDGQRGFELWWLPPAVAEPTSQLERAALVREGMFVIRDDGAPFRPDSWKATDFSDQSLWKRGRGIGLDIIHRAMNQVIYQPATPRGNITSLTFGPRTAVQESGAMS
ncbi:MAG TPA: SpoIIE family protein phosphatase [Candidatus Limnocylindria bacterium]|nr:SpoIIE family protein phosphatase [Candidatus Limnocylindria bacterium]